MHTGGVTFKFVAYLTMLSVTVTTDLAYTKIVPVLN
jgi:hypothetical protein